jgi:hypothetical protein
MKIAGSPHGIQRFEVCPVPEHRAIVAQVRHLVWKEFPTPGEVGDDDRFLRGKPRTAPLRVVGPERLEQQRAREFVKLRTSRPAERRADHCAAGLWGMIERRCASGSRNGVVRLERLNLHGLTMRTKREHHPTRQSTWNPLMPQDAVPDLPAEADRLEAAADEAIAACGGNARDAVKALILANEFLESEVGELMQAVSKAYARGRFKTYSG